MTSGAHSRTMTKAVCRNEGTRSPKNSCAIKEVIHHTSTLKAIILRALTAFLLRRARQRAGLSLAQIAECLGATSINAYARYEQGRSVPTIQKLSELFAAVMPHRDLVLAESET